MRYHRVFDIKMKTSAGAAFNSQHTTCTKFMVYKKSNLWMKPETCPDDGIKYYFFMLCFMDDI